MAGRSSFSFGARGSKLKLNACRVLFRNLPGRLAAVNSTLLASPCPLPWECRKIRLESEELVGLLLDRSGEDLRRLLKLFLFFLFFFTSLCFLSALSRPLCNCASDSQESSES